MHIYFTDNSENKVEYSILFMNIYVFDFLIRLSNKSLDIIQMWCLANFDKFCQSIWYLVTFQ